MLNLQQMFDQKKLFIRYNMQKMIYIVAYIFILQMFTIVFVMEVLNNHKKVDGTFYFYIQKIDQWMPNLWQMVVQKQSKVQLDLQILNIVLIYNSFVIDSPIVYKT
eukprot:TRINITY_DN204_c3_g1_i2.p1 TRINITY_DN204_c3_g1~~TRINITY_DN204_c3_g1_i2.p1  ORF type:complete len:106 (-),score=0.51 TRINITY_DN204_c3_g1_i2:95-412(-)